LAVTQLFSPAGAGDEQDGDAVIAVELVAQRRQRGNGGEIALLHRAVDEPQRLL
jgi:hypothetical protein